MAKNTSILLGDYFEHFISAQVKTGKFSSASEVVRAALRLLELEEKKAQLLTIELEKGEQSGFLDPVDSTAFLKSLHKKHGLNDV